MPEIAAAMTDAEIAAAMAEADAYTPSHHAQSSSQTQKFLAAALAGGIALNGVMLYSFGSAWFRKGAPFVPTAQSKLSSIFGPNGLLRAVPQPRKHMVDLGSGGGALVRAAVRHGGFARGTGYEINPPLVAYSNMRSTFTGGRERFFLRSLWEADVADADLVFVYGVPSMLPELQAKLTRELPANAHVVSNAFPFPKNEHWEEIEEQWVDAGMSQGTLDDSSKVYLYRIMKAA